MIQVINVCFLWLAVDADQEAIQ
ncbi:hypothetical protein MED297_17168 [Reinekea sp. MED297]|uniref:Uncharacterized protein n=1 Tax=Reinekea blandensis MED297 TaxID=314283 RepID=A4BFJ9_9GAMM|nr:hypothetical protein MED297_17168 [Reinekea sp. MED297] [Reinekea blandensis MED297]